MDISATSPLMVVDDSDDDYEIIERAFKKNIGLANEIIHFNNGADALKYLRREPPYTDPVASPRPCVILLDLNMPGMDGHTVLSKLKTDDDLRRLPVVILTTSDNDRDIAESYDRGANSFMVKSIRRDDILQSMTSLKQYWLDTAKLPPR